jgi:hypothetical protein
VFSTRISIAFCLTILFASAYAQTPAKYWVAFTDKNGTPYSTAKPEAFLSPRAIELRKAHGIAIDERDLPVNPDYVRQVLALDTAARCFTTSKWLNGMTVYAMRDDMKEAIEKLPFVDSVQRTIAMKEPEPPIEPAYVFPENNAKPTFSYQSDIQKNNDFDYGKAASQVRVNNVHWLHRLGFHGEGMQMMILDGGFQNIDSISCFEILRNDNRLLVISCNPKKTRCASTRTARWCSPASPLTFPDGWSAPPRWCRSMSHKPKTAAARTVLRRTTGWPVWSMPTVWAARCLTPR